MCRKSASQAQACLDPAKVVNLDRCKFESCLRASLHIMWKTTAQMMLLSTCRTMVVKKTRSIWTGKMREKWRSRVVASLNSTCRDLVRDMFGWGHSMIHQALFRVGKVAYIWWFLPERQFPSEEGPGHLHLATVQTPVERKFATRFRDHYGSLRSTWLQSATSGLSDMIFMCIASTWSRGKKQEQGLEAVLGCGDAVAPPAVIKAPPRVTRSNSRLVRAMLETKRMTAWLGWGLPTCRYWE